ncbi:MAG: hypothetical protein LBL42_05955 [Tannerella sp.]|jgi:hypothetical protein|nr:hypothetical protein [Tannerella sp.]
MNRTETGGRTHFPAIRLSRCRIGEEVESISIRKGIFSDGRPFIEETWYEDIYMLTVFMPPSGLKADDYFVLDEDLATVPPVYEEVRDCLIREGYRPWLFVDSARVSICCCGADDDRLLSINIVLEDGALISGIPFLPKNYRE